MLNFSGRHYPPEIILQCVRWYVSYGISYRDLEEMMSERGIEMDNATLNRWVLKYAPEIERKSRRYKRQVHGSWRLDETYIKTTGISSALPSLWLVLRSSTPPPEPSQALSL